jgi:3'-phosphoadenosine 5'-phosphosulfate sulfotransferase (PAPS reductase)/FAD synthetase
MTDEMSKRYDKSRWMFMLNAPFNVSKQCCTVMKKSPIHKYAKETGRLPMTAQMASESRLRTSQWLLNGCNGFDMKNPISNPMAFWTEQDVLLYIKMNNLPICSVYGEIVEDRAGTDEVEGQMTMSDIEGWEDMEIFDAERLPLKTTGCSRTGCMFCGYGCHLENDGEGRFERMKQTHPKQYEYIMKPWDEGGLGYKDVIDWMNENGGLSIKY